MIKNSETWGYFALGSWIPMIPKKHLNYSYAFWIVKIKQIFLQNNWRFHTKFLLICSWFVCDAEYLGAGYKGSCDFSVDLMCWNQVNTCSQQQLMLKYRENFMAERKQSFEWGMPNLRIWHSADFLAIFPAFRPALWAWTTSRTICLVVFGISAADARVN